MAVARPSMHVQVGSIGEDDFLPDPRAHPKEPTFGSIHEAHAEIARRSAARWAGAQVVKEVIAQAPELEPLRVVIVDRLTGEQYNPISFTDDKGCIATLDGCDEYYMPAGSYDTKLV